MEDVKALEAQALHLVKDEDKDAIKKARAEVNGAVFAVGELELNYLQAKSQCMQRLDAAQKELSESVNDAAKKIGLHPNRKKYAFNEASMTFKEMPGPADSILTQSPSAALAEVAAEKE